jgi:type IV pilus assembly protein PilM
MLKSLFLPDRIGTKRLLAERITGIAVHDDAVRVATVYAKRNKTVLESLFEIQLPAEGFETQKERIIEALKQVAPLLKPTANIRIALPSSLVVFKEITLHFVDTEKIRMVLEYEIESMLPFSTRDAIIDFIITKTDTANQTSQVLVAAIRNQDLADYLELFNAAQINPMAITIDLFAEYGLFSFISEKNNPPQTVALVDLGLHTVRIALISNGELRLTRHLPRGLISVLKQVSEETHMPMDELEVKLSQLGMDALGSDTINHSAVEHFALLVNDIQFTLNSFSIKLALSEEISRILLTGALHKVKGFIDFCSTTMQIPCAVFEPQKILALSSIQNKLTQEPANWAPFTFALGTALVHPTQYDFDLRRKSFVFYQKSLAKKQLIVACCMSFLLFLIIGIEGYLDLNDLHNEVTLIEQREINKFKAENIFPKDKFPKNPTLGKVIREAERFVNEKSELWAPFTQARMNALDIWLQLTSIINKKQFDVTIKEIAMSTKDSGKPKLEIDGLFKSKTGDHFVDWGGLLGRFKESRSFKVVDYGENPAPEGGVDFSVTMTQRDE